MRWWVILCALSALAISQPAATEPQRQRPALEWRDETWPSIAPDAHTWLGPIHLAVANDGSVSWIDGANQTQRWLPDGRTVAPRVSDALPYFTPDIQSRDGRVLAGVAVSETGDVVLPVRSDARGRTLIVGAAHLPYFGTFQWSPDLDHAALTQCSETRCSALRWSARRGLASLPDLAPDHPERSTWTGFIAADGSTIVGTSYVGTQAHVVWWDRANRIHSGTRPGDESSDIVVTPSGAALATTSCAGARCTATHVDTRSGAETQLGDGRALAISNDGRAVLWARDLGAGQRELMRWSRGARAISIGFLDATDQAQFVEGDANDVAIFGWSRTARWTPASGLDELVLPGDDVSATLAWGHRFHVALSCGSATACQLVRWFPERGVEPVLEATIADHSGLAFAATPSGKRVVFICQLGARCNSALWTPDGEKPFPLPGVTGAYVLGERVLLSACDPICNTYLWDFAGELVALRLPEHSQSEAFVPQAPFDAPPDRALVGRSCDSTGACGVWGWTAKSGVRDLAAVAASVAGDGQPSEIDTSLLYRSPDSRWLVGWFPSEGRIFRLDLTRALRDAAME